MQRFIREAKAASALNHPNVATIYDLGEADGISFIAMEYVEGQTLSARIGGHPLASAEIVEIGLQVADALEAAHTKGITHRDIKPANLMLTPRGQVKVLDFGLAKISRAEGQALSSDAPTASGTLPGVVLGTVQYMSPEQVLGREVDHRSDIFSLGVALYEMATGRLPFAGATATETIDRVLHAQPEAISRVNDKVPGELERIVRKCLEKERERRYQSARELLVDLKNLQRDSHPGAVAVERIAPQRWSRGRRLVLAALAVAMLTLGSVGLSRLLRRDQAIDSIAVLPFVNASGNPEAEYLSDGITESLINSLSQLPQLKRVIARTTAFTYKGKAVDPRQIHQELNVRAVLTGRLVQRGDTLTIQVDLMDGAAGTQLWGERYTRKLADILAVQDEIARQIAEKLRLKLSGEEQQRLVKRYTENTEAYQLYFKGRFFWHRFIKDDFRKGIDYFKQALDKDPNYALAYAGLADSYGILGLNFLPPKEYYPKAKAYAVKAVELDETLAEAHAALGALKHFYDWDFPGAERELKRALELDPRSGLAHTLYGINLGAVGRADEAIAESKRGLDLDPLSAVISADLGDAYYFARQYDQAIEQLRKTLELDPNIPFAHLRLAQAYAQEGRYAETITQLAQVRTLTESWPPLMAELGYTYAASGQREAAQKLLQELKGRAAREYINPYFIALLYLGLGEEEQALVWLDKAYEERSGWITRLKVEPRFDRLRADPRFQDLARRVGLQP
jgi:serine/threonine protein kinase/Flp pilus assembly protein TadD